MIGVITSAVAGLSLRSGLAIGAGLALSIVCYRLAVLATDDWDAAFRAVVDNGRSGVAAAFGLQIPANFADERHMWRVVNTLVRRPYTYSESKNVALLIEQFRQVSIPNSSTVSSQIVPPSTTVPADQE